MKDDELYGRGLRDLMLAVPVPPSRADIADAVATGRRRVRGRKVGLSTLAVLVVAGAVSYAVSTGPRRAGPAPVTVKPSASGPCRVDAMQAVPGGPNLPHATDPTGKYVVGSSVADEKATPILWTDGKPKALPVEGMAMAVNAAGTVAGHSGDGATTTAWIYQGGTVTTLPKLAGYGGSDVTGINAAGDVSGWVTKGSGLDNTRAVVWRAGKPATVLQAPSSIGTKDAGTDVRAIGIADDRTVVGEVRGVAVTWSPAGAVHALPFPTGYDDAGLPIVRYPYAYTSVGKLGGGLPTALVRWDLRTRQPTVIDPKVEIPGDATIVVSGTSGGWMLLGSTKSPSLLIAPDGTVEPLPRPVTAAADDPVVATAVSDNAKVVVGVDGAGPLIWHC